MQMYLNTLTDEMVRIVPKTKISAHVDGHGKVTCCQVRTIYEDDNCNGRLVNFASLKPLTKKEEMAIVKKHLEFWNG